MDGEFTESHETDVDCGGHYCSPCPLEKVGCNFVQQVLLLDIHSTV